jgi:hypothetical protein
MKLRIWDWDGHLGTRLLPYKPGQLVEIRNHSDLFAITETFLGKRMNVMVAHNHVKDHDRDYDYTLYVSLCLFRHPG